MAGFFTTGSYYVEPRALAQFVADDPWTGEPATRWVLVLYLMEEAVTGIDAAVASAQNRLRKDDLPGPGRRAFGFGEIAAIEREAEAKPMFLPHALAFLWRDGACPAEAIPRVLHDLEPRLIWSDCRFLDFMTHSARYLFGVAALVALAILTLLIYWQHMFAIIPAVRAGLPWMAIIPLLGALGMVVGRMWLRHRLRKLMGMFRARLAA